MKYLIETVALAQLATTTLDTSDMKQITDTHSFR